MTTKIELASIYLLTAQSSAIVSMVTAAPRNQTGVLSRSFPPSSFCLPTCFSQSPHNADKLQECENHRPQECENHRPHRPIVHSDMQTTTTIALASIPLRTAQSCAIVRREFEQKGAKETKEGSAFRAARGR
jgi:hypothetical protein